MKKLSLFLLAFLPLTLGACTPNSDGPTNIEPSINETTSASSEAEAVVVKGIGELTWHFDVTFLCLANVTIKEDIILKVEISDASEVTTDAFTGYLDGKEAYLNQYVNKTVQQIIDLKISDPKDVTNHYDGGSIDGCIDVITGASASSTVIAKAVKDACLKYMEEK